MAFHKDRRIVHFEDEGDFEQPCELCSIWRQTSFGPNCNSASCWRRAALLSKALASSASLLSVIASAVVL